MVISTDSWALLPPKLSYDLIGPLILAAVDRHLNSSAYNQQISNGKHKHALQGQSQAETGALAVALQDQEQQDQQQLGLRLIGIDLQQPVAAPLKTCMAAYSCLQQLNLHELNIDVTAAQALGSILNSGCMGRGSACSLQSLMLDGVFLCGLAWQALCEGLAAGCKLKRIRWGSLLGLCQAQHCQRQVGILRWSLQYGSGCTNYGGRLMYCSAVMHRTLHSCLQTADDGPMSFSVLVQIIELPVHVQPNCGGSRLGCRLPAAAGAGCVVQPLDGRANQQP